MSKYDDIWPQAEREALWLKSLGYTPQRICTTLAKQFFNDPEKYNTVKGWHVRTFPGEWSSGGNQNPVKEGQQQTHCPRPQPQPYIGIPYQQQSGHFIQNPSTFLLSHHHQHDSFCTQGGCVPQMSAGINHSPHQQESLQHTQNSHITQLRRGAAIDTIYQQHISPYQASSYTLLIPRASRDDRDKVDNPQYHDPGLTSQMQPVDLDSPCQHGQSFLDLSQNAVEMEDDEKTGCLDADILHDHRLIQENEAARQYDPIPYQSSDLRLIHHPRVSKLSSDPSRGGSRNNYTNYTLNSNQSGCPHEGEYGTLKSSTKHCRTNSTFDSLTPPSHYPLLPIPTAKFAVIHKGHNQTSWRPVGAREGGIVGVDPNGFGTDHPRKRIKGQPGSKTRDSLARYQLQHNLSNSVMQGTSTSQSEQTDTLQSSTVNQDNRASKTLGHSNPRDSGYASIFDSSVLDSIRSSLSSLNLADDVNFKTEHKEVVDGFVDVKFKAKWRMRLSQFEMLRDTSNNSLGLETPAD